MKRAFLIVVLALGGCGKVATLQPATGKALPPAPYGATAKPDADQLTAPPPQARPKRSDEFLGSSQERRDDSFDLPPPH